MEPLAAKIRPKNLEEFVGQEHLTGPRGPLRVALEERHAFSFVLWGPPGTGKTTLAKIYANALSAEFHELSAVSAGKDDIRKILGKGNEKSPKHLEASPRGDASRYRWATVTVLFLDEIHRFNKAQQDFLLPYVESGEIILIGATTENPSFEVIPALLSRMRVFILNELRPEDMEKIIDRTDFEMDEEARCWIIAMANGDARQMLSMLENTYRLYKKITVETLTDTLQNKYLRFDKKGEEHYNTISGFIKSMRASQPNAALHYLARMIAAGEDPLFIARRMVVFASEDVGMAQPTALVVANEVFRAVETIGLPECRINLAHGVVYLALAPKDRRVYDGIEGALADVNKHGNLPIPMNIRNPVTKLMKEVGYGKGYEAYSKEDLLPDKLKGTIYLKPGSSVKSKHKKT